MTPEDARSFLRHNHHAVLSTFRRDGMPQMSPVAATIDGQGRVTVSTRVTAMKTKNLRRDPRVSLCVIPDAFFGPWCQVEGTAEIVERPEAIELLVDYYRTIVGEHPDWADYRAAMEQEKRVLLRFEIERAGPSVSG